MNRFAAAALIGAAFAMPASAVTVQTASGDWSYLPKLRQQDSFHLNEKMQAKLFEIAQSNRCASLPLKQGRLDFSITFATQYAPDGNLQRLILPQLNCPDAEGVISGAVLEMIRGGDYSPSGNSPEGWYQGGLRFSFAGDDARDPGVPATTQYASAAGNPNEIICEKVEQIGTRLGAKRTCMTRAEWKEQRRQNREVVEKAQQTRCNGEGAGQC
jgi:hypothetical protein